ncbi:hypothetical protein DSO57_1031039 [Entomophthora muscae]|uniref:Uncharacterized protein n=1 Tax=Entomophthora muscae TaxID=34485 RepID=A0ACC2RRU3_9FUNG|nr:hypothetical protein DSO57_1031039 [Entomophthora muscae]
MKEIPTAPPLPSAPPTQDFSKLGFVYITILGLTDQAVPHTGSYCPLATALNYLVWIVPVVYMAFQAQPASPVGAQPDSDMGCDRRPREGLRVDLVGSQTLLKHSCCSPQKTPGRTLDQSPGIMGCSLLHPQELRGQHIIPSLYACNPLITFPAGILASELCIIPSAQAFPDFDVSGSRRRGVIYCPGIPSPSCQPQAPC